ncbi:hypothetical protein ACKXGF_11345 [Alkalibacillus sp. S2W]|uniref:hypothetical protein n=1 Tax=Alkalibacillus sp. S2W TaxID=3386553 RepID=UPI00398CB951
MSSKGGDLVVMGTAHASRTRCDTAKFHNYTAKTSHDTAKLNRPPSADHNINNGLKQSVSIK